jgi:hypothetical protein
MQALVKAINSMIAQSGEDILIEAPVAGTA